MSQSDEKAAIPLTPEAEKEGQDPFKVSDPPFENVKEGQVDADSD